jgi:hypothetical protein
VTSWKWATSLALAFACSACRGAEVAERPASEPDLRDPTAPIQTDTTIYTLTEDSIGWGTALALSFRNVTPDTLYAINCNGALTLAVERRDAADWSLFLAPMTNGCLSAPVVVAPGDSLGIPWTIYGARPGSNAGPQFADSTFTGDFRLVWWNLVSHYDVARRELGDSVPLRFRVSNTFRFEAPPDVR